MTLPLDRPTCEPITKEEQTGRVWTCKCKLCGGDGFLILDRVTGEVDAAGWNVTAPTQQTCPRCKGACVRVSPCVSCRGKRSKRSGASKQNVVRKALGIPPTRYRSQSSNEENWRHAVRWEVKSGKQVESLAARYLAAEKQSDQNKAEGDPRPFAFVAMPNGWGSDGVVGIRLSQLAAFVEAMTEEAAS